MLYLLCARVLWSSWTHAVLGLFGTISFILTYFRSTISHKVVPPANNPCPSLKTKIRLLPHCAVSMAMCQCWVQVRP